MQDSFNKRFKAHCVECKKQSWPERSWIVVSQAAELVCWPLLLEGRGDALFFPALVCPSCALAMCDVGLTFL